MFSAGPVTVTGVCQWPHSSPEKLSLLRSSPPARSGYCDRRVVLISGACVNSSHAARTALAVAAGAAEPLVVNSETTL